MGFVKYSLDVCYFICWFCLDVGVALLTNIVSSRRNQFVCFTCQKLGESVNKKVLSTTVRVVWH